MKDIFKARLCLVKKAVIAEWKRVLCYTDIGVNNPFSNSVQWVP